MTKLPEYVKMKKQAEKSEDAPNLSGILPVRPADHPKIVREEVCFDMSFICTPGREVPAASAPSTI